jgi:hypothetical protein
MCVLRRLAVLVLAGGLLAGCGGGSDDPPSAGPSPSSTPTASAAPSAPVLPEAAKQNTKSGAVAFVKFYVAAFNHARVSGDVVTLSMLGTKRCVSCRDVASAISDTYSAGGRATGGQWIIESATASRAADHQWAVYLSSHFAPGNTFPSKDAPPQHSNGGPLIANFYVAFDHGWKVTRWTRAN